MGAIQVRLLAARDSLVALIALLHRAYAPLAAQVQWEGKHYRSVIVRKSLDRSPLREQLQCMARYSLWATKRQFAVVDGMPEADYRRHAGLFFKSVHGTLSHLLVAEHGLWRPRFAEGAAPALALDAEVEPERARLRERLLEGALAWLPLLEVWPESRLLGALDCQRMGGQRVSLPFAATLLHVFNHGTHHRGQISAALTAMGHAGPELDLVFMLQAEQAA